MNTELNRTGIHVHIDTEKPISGPSRCCPSCPAWLPSAQISWNVSTREEASFCSTRQTDVVGDWTWKVAILDGINNVVHKVLSLRNTTVRVASWLPFLDESILNLQIPPGLHHLGSLAIWSILESLRLAAKRRTRLPAEYIMLPLLTF